MKKKIVLTITAIALAIVTIATTLVLTVPAYAEDRYWSEPDTLKQVDISKYEGEIETEDDIHAEVDELILNHDSVSIELNSSERKEIEECNTMIIKYFNEVHNVDVSEKLYAVKVKKQDFTYIADDYGIVLGGVSFEELGRIYLSTTFDDEFYFRNTYIHEAIHIIGICNTEGQYITEGITEALNEEVHTYNGQYYANLSLYDANTFIAKQIIEADKNLVYNILTDSNFSFKDTIDSVLGEGFAEALDNVCNVHCSGKDSQELRFYMQYITAEYIKQISSENAKEIVSKNNVLPEGRMETMWLFM